VALLMLAACCAKPGRAANPTEHPGSEARRTTVKTAGPISFDVSGGLDGAKLQNTSTTPQHVLHTPFIQPSRLRLYRPDRTEVEARDERDLMKFDTTVSRPMYQEVAPGAKLPLFQPRTKSFDNLRQLIWGPYSFPALAPGQYQATLEWTSERNDYVDDNGKPATLKGVWLGKVVSARFPVRVQ